MDKITNLLPEGYDAPCILLVRGVASTDCPSPELLNGCDSGEEDLIKKLPETLKEAIYDKFANIVLRYNYPSSELFTTTRYLAPRALSEEQMEELLEFTLTEWENCETMNGDLLDKEAFDFDSKVDIFPKDGEAGVVMLPIEIPENLLWLPSIFDTPEKQMMYEDFMANPLVYERMRKMCENKGIPIPEEATETAALPIHQKEKNTGEILISTTAYEAFRQFQYCQNFLRGFDKGTAEHDMGKLMMLDPKFCEDMMTTTEMKIEGKEIHDEEGNYQRSLRQAIKKIQKNPRLMAMYENNLQYIAS